MTWTSGKAQRPEGAGVVQIGGVWAVLRGVQRPDQVDRRQIRHRANDQSIRSHGQHGGQVQDGCWLQGHFRAKVDRSTGRNFLVESFFPPGTMRDATMRLWVSLERQRLLWRRQRRWPRSSCRRRVRITFDTFISLFSHILIQKHLRGGGYWGGDWDHQGPAWICDAEAGKGKGGSDHLQSGWRFSILICVNLFIGRRPYYYK